MSPRILVVVFFLLSPSLQAQVFSKIFGHQKMVEANNFSMTPHADGYLFGLTEIDVADDFRNSMSLVQTDFNGLMQDAYTYASADSTRSITCQQVFSVGNGDVLISGIYSVNNTPPYYPYVMSINSQGGINWAKKISLSNCLVAPVLTRLSDNSILCRFKYNDGAQHYVFCQLSENGDFSSPYELNTPFGVEQNLLTGAGTFDLLLSNGNLLNVDNDLATVNWRKKFYHEIGIEVAKAANDDYLVVASQVAFPGYMTVMRLDGNGAVIWSKYVEAWLGDRQDQTSIFDIVGFHFITETATGEITVSANSEGGLNGSFNITFDAAGNYLSNRKITSFKHKMKLLNDQEFLLGGFTGAGAISSANFIFEKRTLGTSLRCDTSLTVSIAEGAERTLAPDTLRFIPTPLFAAEDIEVVRNFSTLTVAEHCEVNLTGSGGPVTPGELMVYPNPTSGPLQIISDEPVTDVRVLDVYGNTLIHSSTTTINVNKLPQGSYILLFMRGNKYYTRKIVKY